MTSVSINREASDKTKGFRLQKVRAIELMLKSINKDTDSVFYTAIENVEDVLKEGDTIEVKLINIDERSGKLKLSRKVLLPKPEREEK